MATIIDALIVTLGLDPSGYKKGQADASLAMKQTKDEATATAKELEARGKQAAEFFGQIRNQALGLMTVLLGGRGIKEFVTGTIDTVAAVSRLANSMGMTTPDLAAYQNMIKLNGGSADAAAASFANLSQAMETYRETGQASDFFLQALSQIGGGANSSPLEIVKLFNKWAQGRSAQEVSTYGVRLGLDPDSIYAAQQKTVAQYNAMLAQGRAVAPSDKDAAALQALQKSLEGFYQSLDKIGRTLEVDVAPAVTEYLDAARGFVDKNPAVVEAAMALSTALIVLGAAVLTLKTAGAISSLTGLSGGITVLAKALALLGVNAAVTAVDPNDKLGTWIDTNVPGASWLDNLASKVGAGRSYAQQALASGDVLGLFRTLENSGDSATSSAGAIGRYQIKPGTAQQYGFDPSKLKDPAYNEQVASAILADLAKRYNGDLGAMAVAYNWGPGHADKWIAGGRNNAMLPLETQRYLAREQALTGGGDNTSSEIHIGTIVVNTKATDAAGVAGGIHGALQDKNIAAQANTGLN